MAKGPFCLPDIRDDTLMAKRPFCLPAERFRLSSARARFFWWPARLLVLSFVFAAAECDHACSDSAWCARKPTPLTLTTVTDPTFCWACSTGLCEKNQVPAFVWSQSHLPSETWGTSYDKLMHSTDWVPTLASLAGAELGRRCARGVLPADDVDIRLALVVDVSHLVLAGHGFVAQASPFWRRLWVVDSTAISLCRRK